MKYVAPEDFNQYSIDELFMDVTASYHFFATRPYELAQMVQRDIYHETKIFSTVGIGANPLLAKLSMDLETKKQKKVLQNGVMKMWSENYGQ